MFENWINKKNNSCTVVFSILQFDSRGKQFGYNILTKIQLSIKIKLKKLKSIDCSWGVFSWVWAHKEFTITWNAFL